MSYEDRTSTTPAKQHQGTLPLGEKSPQEVKTGKRRKRRKSEHRSERSEHEAQDVAKSLAPESSNTGAFSSPKGKVTGGIDWLDARCYGSWDKAKWAKLRLQLAVAQLAAREDDEEKSVIELEEGDWLRCAPMGAKSGSKSTYFSYVCQTHQGFKFYFRDRAEFDDKNANVVIHIGSVPLMIFGHQLAWRMAKELLASLGFDLVRNTVSRVDLCTDLPGEDTDAIVKDFVNGAVIRQARTGQTFFCGYIHTGVAVGKEIKLRIYDKLLEVQHNEEKLAVMKEHRWGGVIPECATRVEYQLRRKTLRERWKVTSVEDLFDKLHYIVMFLTWEWFRMTSKPISKEDRENKNHQRYELSRFWEEVTKGFFAWVGEPEKTYSMTKSYKVDAKALKKQALGCLVAAAVKTGAAVKTLHEFQSFVLRETSKAWEEIQEKLAIKAIVQQFGFPVRPPLIAESMIPF